MTDKLSSRPPDMKGAMDVLRRQSTLDKRVDKTKFNALLDRVFQT